MYNYIHEQPKVLKEIFDQRERLVSGFKSIDANTKELILVASGSSYNAAIATKYFLEKTLNIPVSIEYPYVFNNYRKRPKDYTVVIAISQTGKSTATIESIDKCVAWNIDNAVLTSDIHSPITKNAASVIEIPCGEEKAPFKTKGYTATILILYIFGLEISYSLKKITQEEYEFYTIELEKVVLVIMESIERSESWYDSNQTSLNQGNKIMVVGYGPNYGTALEGGIKLTETIRCPSNGYELEEFMHGPNLAVDEDYHILFISTPGAGKERINTLAKYLRQTSPYCYVISDKDDDDNKDDKNIYLSGDIIEDFTPLQFIIPLQLISYKIAVSRGIDPLELPFADFNDYLKTKA